MTKPKPGAVIDDARNDDTVHVRIPAALRAAVERVAKERRWTLGQAVRVACEEFVKADGHA